MKVYIIVLDHEKNCVMRKIVYTYCKCKNVSIVRDFSLCFVTFPFGLRSGLVIDCIDSWSLHSPLLLWTSYRLSLMAMWLFLAVPRVCLQFAILVFPDHTRLLFLVRLSRNSACCTCKGWSSWEICSDNQARLVYIQVIFYDDHQKVKKK